MVFIALLQTPNSIRAIQILQNSSDQSLQLAEYPLPSPSASQVLIKVAAAGVNRPDLMQRLGFYPPPPGAPEILGLEIAGTVMDSGADVAGFKTGDKICALVSGGGYAEYCLAEADCCLPVPQNLSFVEAAGLPGNFFHCLE